MNLVAENKWRQQADIVLLGILLSVLRIDIMFGIIAVGILVGTVECAIKAKK